MTKQELVWKTMGNLEVDGDTKVQLNPILEGVLVKVIGWAIEKCGEKLLDKITNGQNLNFFEKMSLRKQMRSSLKETDGVDRIDQKQYSELLENACMKTMHQVTPDEVRALLGKGE